MVQDLIGSEVTRVVAQIAPSMEGGQASYAPSIREQGQAVGSAMDILQQITQALQRAT